MSFAIFEKCTYDSILGGDKVDQCSTHFCRITEDLL
jgi:hypothetical protein